MSQSALSFSAHRCYTVHKLACPRCFSSSTSAIACRFTPVDVCIRLTNFAALTLSLSPKYDKAGVLGGDNVGKTAFVIRFVTGSYGSDVGKSESGVAQYGRHGVLGDEPCSLDIADIDGTGKLREQAIYTSDVFLLVFEISSRKSFKEIPRLYTEILDMKRAAPKMLVVGNKSDRETDREVSVLEARKLGEKLGCQFLEASALENQNVDEAFLQLVPKWRLPTGGSIHDTVDNDEKEVQDGHGLVAPNSVSGSVASVLGLLTRNLLLCIGRRK